MSDILIGADEYLELKDEVMRLRNTLKDIVRRSQNATSTFPTYIVAQRALNGG